MDGGMCMRSYTREQLTIFHKNIVS
jgi:hypothetical protein